MGVLIMSELKVEVVKIDDVTAHPNADRMELAFVGGYQVCVQLGAYISGDTAVYIPVDSVLPEKLEAHIFGENAKVKLHKSRVRAIKLRGAVSQGMLMSTNETLDYFISQRIVAGANLRDDLTELLGITKYQPPVKNIPQGMNTDKNKVAARHNNPFFSKYTDISHLRKYVEALEDKPVYVTEKIHGTNFRCGWVPFVPKTIFQKLKNILGLCPADEFVYGSHNVQLQNKGGKNAFSDNVYKRIVRNHNLKKKIPKGHVWYGEIFGDKIQTGYEYGLKDGSVDVAFMDIKWVATDGHSEYMDFSEVISWVEGMGEQVVPYQLFSLYDFKAIVEKLNEPGRVSQVDGMTQPVEGFVIRPLKEQSFYGGRLILKLLSDAYLLNKDNTGWK
jgi:RNA ligase (TIGR02306 family)